MPETRADCTESTPPRHFSLEISIGAPRCNRHGRCSRQFEWESADPFPASPFTRDLRTIVIWQAFRFLKPVYFRLLSHCCPSARSVHSL